MVFINLIIISFVSLDWANFWISSITIPNSNFRKNLLKGPDGREV